MSLREYFDSSFRDAPLGADPESTFHLTDGFRVRKLSLRPGMTEGVGYAAAAAAGVGSRAGRQATAAKTIAAALAISRNSVSKP